MNIDFKKEMLVIVMILLVVLSFVAGYYVYGSMTNSKSTNVSAGNETQSTLKIIDDTGRVVTVYEPVTRIVSLAPSNTEIVFDLHLRNELVGVDTSYDYTQQQIDEWSLSNVTQVTNYTTIEYETILSLKPSIVLAAGITSPSEVYKMASLGLTVVVLNPENMHQILNDIYLVGEITGRTTVASTLISNLTTILNNVELTVRYASEPSVLLTYYPDSYGKGYWTYGPGSFGERLIIDAGGYNIASNQSSGFPEISEEGLQISNPSFIFVGTGPYGLNISSYSSFNVIWQNLTAVQEHTVYALNDAYISEPDPTLFYILQEMAYALHPQLFNITGNLTGTIYNGTSPLSNIKVSILNSTNVTVATATTSINGTFVFNSVPCGSYTVAFSYGGKRYVKDVTVIYLNMQYLSIYV